MIIINFRSPASCCLSASSHQIRVTKKEKKVIKLIATQLEKFAKISNKSEKKN